GPFAPEAEFLFDPLRPRLVSVTEAEGNIQVLFQGAPEINYGVNEATSLSQPVIWQDRGNLLSDSEGLFGFQESNTNGSSNRFYRITYPPAP
ncbi:MAG: hypothetical protein ACK4UN_21535, partial [Limisphaerales bacterium]